MSFKNIVIILIAIGAGFVLIGIFKNKGVKENLPGQFFKEQSRIHIQPSQEHPSYSSNPPSSGWHWADPAPTGIYSQELPDEQIIHNLEHSHIWISYHPDLVNSEIIENLADIAKDFGSKIIITPRSKNDSPIAVAAWQYLIKLDSLNKEAIVEFIRAHRGKAGPENPPDPGFKDFR